jgi:uncharacterized tellurite resistance protein B-like protein
MSLDMSAVKGLSEPKLEALVELMFLAASADDEFSDVERAHFAKSVAAFSDGRIDSARLEQLLARAAEELGKSDRAVRLQSVKDRLPEAAARKVGLALAIQVTAADGIIRTSERELILETAEALEIDPDEAANLVATLGR